MKYTALVVLLVLLQAPSPVPRKAADNPASDSHNVKQKGQSNQKPATQSQSAISRVGTQPEQQNNDAVKPESREQSVRVSELPPVSVTKDWWDRSYVIFTGLLVIIGGLGVCAAIRSLWAIEEQAREMIRQRGIMQGQLDAMNSQLTEMKAAGRLAQEQFDLTVSKEKPRLSIEVDPLEFVRADYVNARVRYWVRYSGITPAFITDSSAAGQIGDSPAAPPPLFTLAMKLPKTVLADTEEMTAPIFPPNFAIEDMDALSAGARFIHFLGFIKYTDVFSDKERETTFCFLWKVDTFYGPDARVGRWVECGPPEANRTT